MSTSAQPAVFDESRFLVNGVNGTSEAFSAEASGRRLIVNADDLGMSEAISEAIFQGHLRGIVTSASLLVNFADSERAARRARELPDLAVGLHFNLTQGRPISSPTAVPSLVDDDGFFLPKELQFAGLRVDTQRREQVGIELTAQAERIQELGIEATHVDGHQGVHRVAAVEDTLRELAPPLGLPAARVRLGYPILGPTASFGDRLRQALASLRGTPEMVRDWMQKKRFRRAGLRTSDGQLRRMRIYPRPNDAPSRLLARLGGLEAGDFELVLHPGPIGGDPNCSVASAERHGEDARLAMDAQLRERIDGLGVELISYRNLR